MFQIKLVPTKTNIPFVNWRKPAMAISALLVLISVVMAFVPGPNFGIDFRGGILIEVQTQNCADTPPRKPAFSRKHLNKVISMCGNLDLDSCDA